MTFDEVVSVLKTNKNPDESYIGIFFRSEDNYFGYYQLHGPELDDPDWIGINFEGSFLFDDCGEEDSYSLDDVPFEAKSLFYKNSKDVPAIGWDKSEYALFKLFPTLPNPDSIWTDSEKQDFIKAVNEQLQNWRAT
jgi:hypothetical protein